MVTFSRTTFVALLIAILLIGCGETIHPSLHDARQGVAVNITHEGSLPNVSFRAMGSTPARCHLDIQMSIELSQGETSTLHTNIAPVRVDLSFQPLASGTEFHIDDVTLLDGGDDPDQRGRFEVALKRQSLLGITGTILRGAEANDLRVELPLPPGLHPTLTELLAHVLQGLTLCRVPIPDSIGLGGGWEIRRDLSIRTIQLSQQGNATLTRSESERSEEVSIDFRSQLAAPPQSITPEGVPAGSRCELVFARGSAKGHVDGPFGAVVPNRAECRIDLESELRVFHDGGSDTIRNRAQISYSLAATSTD